LSDLAESELNEDFGLALLFPALDIEPPLSSDSDSEPDSEPDTTSTLSTPSSPTPSSLTSEPSQQSAKAGTDATHTPATDHPTADEPEPVLLPLEHPTNARYLYAARIAIMAADAYSHALFRGDEPTVAPARKEEPQILPLCPDAAGGCKSIPEAADASVLPPDHVQRDRVVHAVPGACARSRVVERHVKCGL
jgi:hypothetical protein